MKNGKTNIFVMASYLLLFLFLTILSCNSSGNKSNDPARSNIQNFAGYNISAPDQTIILPPPLQEISGIAIMDSSSIACVQDEKGIVFIYDLQKNEISSRIPFHGNGDYEDIARINETLYILRSDGDLFEIKNHTSPDNTKQIRLKKLSDNDNEGLCYDHRNNMLLIAPKEISKKDSKDTDMRGIYGFIPATGELIKKPVISFDLSEINEFALENNVFSQEKSKKKDNKGKADIKFRPSAIGIHPVTGNLFVLSAAEKLLFVFNPGGSILNMIRLNPEIFIMPEGITFYENGDMLISNEGRNRQPTLLKFKYKPADYSL